MPVADFTPNNGVTDQPPAGPAQNPTTNGSSSGAIIPDPGVYGAETAAATNAYNNAIAQATAQRNLLYNQYGLTSDGNVDANNPHGQYQQMLGAQAGQQQFDAQNAAARRLGLGGLANQQASQDQHASNNQDWQFQNQVGQVSSNFADTSQNALSTEQSAISKAYNDAMQVALQNMLAQLQAGIYDAPIASKKGGH